MCYVLCDRGGNRSGPLLAWRGQPNSPLFAGETTRWSGAPGRRPPGTAWKEERCLSWPSRAGIGGFAHETRPPGGSRGASGSRRPATLEGRMDAGTWPGTVTLGRPSAGFGRSAAGTATGGLSVTRSRPGFPLPASPALAEPDDREDEERFDDQHETPPGFATAAPACWERS